MILEAILSILLFVGLPIAFFFLLATVKVVYEYQRGIKFTLGKYSGIMNPGLNFVIPVLQSWRRIDTRLITLDIPPQEVMTRDNVPVTVDAVIYFRVEDPKKAIIDVANYIDAVSKYGQTSLRNVAGEVELDELLSKREEIADKLKLIVDEATDEWGIDVELLELQDMKLPPDMKRIIARQAEAEREKRAAIIKAEGENAAADDLVKASTILASADGALHLRQLSVLSDVASDGTNTINFYMPFKAVEMYHHTLEKKASMARNALAASKPPTARKPLIPKKPPAPAGLL